jgi:hypothetical protein
MRTHLCADINFRLFANGVAAAALPLRISYLLSTLSDQVLPLLDNFLKLRAEHLPGKAVDRNASLAEVTCEGQVRLVMPFIRVYKSRIR